MLKRYFSYKKYSRWCKVNKEPCFPWARECDGKEVDEKTLTCNGYVVFKDWLVTK